MNNLFFLLAFVFSFSEGRIATPINLRNVTQIHLDESSPVYFELVPPQAWDAPSYLSISAISQNDCFPSLLAVKYPSLNEYLDYPLTSNPRKAVVFMLTAELESNTKFYIGVSSKIECTIDLMVEEIFGYLLQGEPDQYYRVYELQQQILENKSFAVLTVDIPPFNNADRILIHINALNANKKHFSDLDVFIKKGNQVADSRYYDQYKSSTGLGGISVLISKENSLFCLNCSYSISLRFEEQAILQVHVGILNPVIELKSFPIIDIIDKGKRNTYVVSNIREEILRIDINPITNNLTIYINCGILPNDLDHAQWSFALDSFKEISLGAVEGKNCAKNIYYIVVTGEEETIYSISAQQKVPNNLILQKDHKKKGNILPGEVIMLEAYLPLFAEDKLLFNLKTKGNVHFSVKNCKFIFDCPNLLPSSQHIQKILDQVTEIQLPSEFNYAVVQTQDAKQIKIDPHENGCVPFPIRSNYYRNTPLVVCAYQITLQSKEDSIVEYELSANIEGHSLLSLGVPLEDSVLENDENYYILYVPYPNLKSVSFQIATLSGDVGMFVSNTSQYPKREDDLSNLSHKSFIVFTNSPTLNGTYYITVKGYQASIFTLNANVITQDDREENYSISIQEQVPQKGMILALDSQNEQPFLYYSPTEEAVIRINIEYSIPKEKASYNDDDLEFSASYWSEKESSGSRKPIIINRSYTMLDKILDGVKYTRKSFEIKSNIGEYQFTVKNLNENKLPFSFLVYTDKGADFISLEQNSYHFSQINEGQSEVFKIYLPMKGACYLELSQCSGKFSLSIADSVYELNFLNNIFTSEDDTIFYKYYIEDSTSKYVRVKAEKADTNNETATFLLKHNCFIENWLISFNMAEPGQVMVSESQYRPHDHLLPIKFEPISFPQASKEDYAFYKIVVCQDKGLARSMALWGLIPQDKNDKEKCHMNEINLSLYETKPFDTELSLEEATYYLYIVGSIIHKQESVHSISYEPIVIALKDQNNVFGGHLEKLIGGLSVILVLVLVHFLYKKLRTKAQPNKQMELENFKKKNYEVMTEESSNSNSEGSGALG